MLTFIKLGGSLITDKRVEASFRADIMDQLAKAIASALRDNPQMNLLIGHGSGSFGHFAASRHGTMQSVHTPAQWRGFAEVASAAADLNALVTHALRNADIPVWSIQPSASARCKDGKLIELNTYPIQTALNNGLVPLVYGDVALDDVRGGTIISTETILSLLSTRLPVDRILLLGEVSGVHDSHGAIIEEITPGNMDLYRDVLGQSEGTDVTGGMLTKVSDMLSLVKASPHLAIRIMDGQQADLLYRTLIGDAHPGTVICA